MENVESNARNQSGDNSVLKSRIESAKKQGVTRGVWIGTIVGLVLLLSAGGLGYSFFKKEQNKQFTEIEYQKSSFSKQLTVRDSMINDWLLTFDQIEKDLNSIKEKENLITMKTSDSEMSKSRREQVLDDIQYINTLLESNKKKIASLNAQLKKSGASIAGLQERMATLEASILKYEQEVSDLKLAVVEKDVEIEGLNTKVTSLDMTVAEQNERINNQTYKLNQAYLTSGTFKDLKGKGLVSKEGGFLGIGRKEILTGNLNDSLFAEIDVTEMTTIPVNSKKAKLITDHPEGSYEMVAQDEKTIAYIAITNPDEFWRISKYAVVELVK